jgi:hypothetical protein
MDAGTVTAKSRRRTSPAGLDGVGETHAAELQQYAVAYFNSDGARLLPRPGMAFAGPDQACLRLILA